MSNKQKSKIAMKCDCDCGGMAKPGKRFISGHNMRTPEFMEIKKKNLESQSKMWKGKPFIERFGEKRAKEIGQRIKDTHRKRRELGLKRKPVTQETIDKIVSTRKQKIANGYVNPTKGKTYSQIYGEERAKIENEKRIKTRIETVSKRRKEGKYHSPKKGKYYDELYGERAILEKQKRKGTKGRNSPEMLLKRKLKLQKKKEMGWVSPRKGKTYEEIYGPERVETETHKRIITTRDKSPYYFMGVPFDSNAERKIAKMFYDKLGIVFIDYVNCHVPVRNNKRSCYVDFYIFGMFIEYHPFNSHYEHRTPEEYFGIRRAALDKNGYRKNPLILLEKDSQVKSFIGFLGNTVGGN